MLKNSLFQKIFFLCFLFFSSTSCFNTSGINSAFNLPSVGSNYAPSDSELFYVDVDVKAYEINDEIKPYYEISTTEEYGDSVLRESPSNCEIQHFPSEEDDDLIEREATETLLCILDVPEWEFVIKDFHLIYNFPEGMCEYTRVGLPWHFNYPIIAGPTSIECEMPGEGEDGGGSGFCDARLGSFANCDDRCIEEEENICPGDPKCCYGGEKVDGEEWEPELECFGGPALVTTSGHFNPESFYTATTQALPKGGLRQTISLQNATEVNGNQATQCGNSGGDCEAQGYSARHYTSNSTPYANYLKRLDTSPEDLSSINRSRLPVFLQNSAFYNKAPRLFFEFSCLDGAGEILHQILLMIREWNTMEEFIGFYRDREEEGDPDVEGIEGKDCQYEDRAILEDQVESCNDMRDFDDIGNYYPAVEYSLGEGE